MPYMKDVNMSFPPLPTTDIDWDNLSHQIREVNGHIESRYNSQTKQWSEPDFVKDPFLRIHGLAPALNYAQQAYEGMKAYRSDNNVINIFRPSKHASRLSHSVEYVSIPSVPQEHFLKCVHLAVSLNAEFVPPHRTGACLYIRPVIFGSGAGLALTPQGEYIFTVYVQPISAYHGSDPLKAVIMEDFDRAAPNGTGSAKVGGNYAPVMRWSDAARAKGFGITLHLDSKTTTAIDEFSTSGFVGIKTVGEVTTMVVPESKNIILSITSDSCMALAAHFGWIVEKRVVKYTELSSFDEVLAVGTAASVVPIRSITRESTGEVFEYLKEPGDRGRTFELLYTALKSIQQGDRKDVFGWLEEVKEAAEYNNNGLATNGVHDAYDNDVCTNEVKENVHDNVDGPITNGIISPSSNVANGTLNGINGTHNEIDSTTAGFNSTPTDSKNNLQGVDGASNGINGNHNHEVPEISTNGITETLSIVGSNVPAKGNLEGFTNGTNGVQTDGIIGASKVDVIEVFVDGTNGTHANSTIAVPDTKVNEAPRSGNIGIHTDSVDDSLTNGVSDVENTGDVVITTTAVNVAPDNEANTIHKDGSGDIYVSEVNHTHIDELSDFLVTNANDTFMHDVK